MVLVTNEFCVVLYVKGQRLATSSPDIGLGIVKYIYICIIERKMNKNMKGDL